MKYAKSSWTKTTLSSAVSKIEETDRENASRRFDRFLKVEHMDPESLHIKRFSSQELGDELNPTFYKIFRKGQILFPTRNPHLRRTSLASFDGVCGEKTLTLEANPDLVHPSFIPFLFHSESFYSHATSSIVGSTNPHCRWRDIANYEFLLPPKDQQIEIAKLLWAADDVIQTNLSLLEAAEINLNSTIEVLLHGLSFQGKTIVEILVELSKKTDLITLNNCGEIFKGKGIPKAHLVESGIPCVRYGELYTQHHRIIRKCTSFIEEKTRSQAFKLKKNDVLFAGSGESIAEIGKSAVFSSDQEAYAGSDILIFRPDNMDGVFLGYLMNSQLVRQQLNKLGTGATVMHIYKGDLEKIKIPRISYDDQVWIGEKFEQLFNNICIIKRKLSSSYALQKSLINEFF